MIEKLEFQLVDGFKIAKGGEEIDAETLSISSPTNKVIKYVSILDNELHKAMFNMAQKNISSTEKQDTETEIDGSDIIMALSGGDADLVKCYDCLEKILPLTCFVNDTIPFTTHMYSKMNYKDTKNLLGEYLKFFLGTSLTN
jgi:hypothetical protein